LAEDDGTNNGSKLGRLRTLRKVSAAYEVTVLASPCIRLGGRTLLCHP
jgi:hypothetical protein